jgi:hypothetical protein
MHFKGVSIMKTLLIAMLAVVWSASAFSYTFDYNRDLFVDVSESVSASGVVTETMFGTLAYEDAHEDNSFTAVFESTSGYIYFQGRERGNNFSCYVHNSIKSAEEMVIYRNIVAAFNNGARIKVFKYADRGYCNGAMINKNSWQHLN